MPKGESISQLKISCPIRETRERILQRLPRIRNKHKSKNGDTIDVSPFFGTSMAQSDDRLYSVRSMNTDLEASKKGTPPPGTNLAASAAPALSATASPLSRPAARKVPDTAAAPASG